MLTTVLEQLMDDFHERALPILTPRDVKSPTMAGKANVVVGMRRSGKTWYCYQQLQALLSADLDKRQMLYLNFEDERLLPFKPDDFQEILNTYYRKYPAFKQRTCYLILDEVQRIEGWDRFVRRILDNEKLQVWVTGSSARLLSSEIATSLRGRSVTTEIFPFNFREFLRFHQTEPKHAEGFGAQLRAKMENMAQQYLAVGGFPEIQTVEAELRHQVLQNYLDVVILRDVVERQAVRNTVALRALIRYLLTAPATRFSLTKFYNLLKSQAIACGKNDLYHFLDYLTDSFLIYLAPIHSRSHKARMVNPRKAYAIDTGLLGAMSFRMTEDRGAWLENMVFLHLRRSGHHPEYYHTASGLEVDFVVPDLELDKRSLIQVCWSLKDPTTRQRETAALREAMLELRHDRGLIITWMEEEKISENISVIPAWKWMLSRF